MWQAIILCLRLYSKIRSIQHTKASAVGARTHTKPMDVYGWPKATLKRHRRRNRTTTNAILSHWHTLTISCRSLFVPASPSLFTPQELFATTGCLRKTFQFFCAFFVLFCYLVWSSSSSSSSCSRSNNGTHMHMRLALTLSQIQLSLYLLGKLQFNHP